MIPEIDIGQAAQPMLKRYGDKALEESAARADEPVTAGDDNGVAVWCRTMDALTQLANTTPPRREQRTTLGGTSISAKGISGTTTASCDAIAGKLRPWDPVKLRPRDIRAKLPSSLRLIEDPSDAVLGA